MGATPTGTLAVAIRDDALSALTPIEGDAIGLRVDANGALWTIPSGTVTVDNGGTFAVQVDGDALTALQLIDDIIYTDDTSTHSTGTTKVAGIGAVATPTDGSVGANDIGMLAMSTDRRLHVDAAITAQDIDINIQDGGNSITVDNAGTFAVQEANSGDIQTALELIDDAIFTDDTSTHSTGTTKIMGIGAVATPTDTNVGSNDIGMPAMSTDRRLHVDADIVAQSAGDITIADGGNSITIDGTLTGITNDVSIDDGGNSITVDNGGTFVVQVDGDALTALQLIDDVVFVDDTATHTAATTKVMGIGAVATPTDGSVNANDIGMPAMSTDRRLHVDAQIVGQDADFTIADGGNSLTVDNGGTFAVQAAQSGTWNVATVTTLTTITNDVSIDDGGNSITVDATQLDVDDLAPTADGVAAALDTSQMMNGLTALTPKYAVIDDASSGDNTIVAAVVGKKIRVLALFMVSGGDVLARFEDGAGGTALTGQMDLTTNSGFVLPFNPVGWFETTANTLLNLELDGAVSQDGSLVYVEV